MHDHVDAIVAVRKMFVHGVVDDFPNAVVQRRPVVWIPRYIPGRIRTASSPSRTWMLSAL